MEALGFSLPPTHCHCSRSTADPFLRSCHCCWGAAAALQRWYKPGWTQRQSPQLHAAGEKNVAPVGKSGLCLFLMNSGTWWEVGWKLEETPSVSEWASSSQLPLQLWFNKNRFVMVMLQKAPVLHSRAGQDISFISIFYGKGEHSVLTCRLWCPWWK